MCPLRSAGVLRGHINVPVACKVLSKCLMVVYKHTLRGMKFSQDMSIQNQMPTPEKLFP